jgi:predicted ATPase
MGRERELQLLTNGFAQAQAGHGPIVIFVGKAEMGKSCLPPEFRQQLGAEAIWFETHTMAFERAMAFHPVIDLWERHIRDGHGADGQDMLATAYLPEAVQNLIVQKVEGNLYFIEEVKSLQDVGTLRRRDKHHVLIKPLEEIVVPDTIPDVLMARIDRLLEAPRKTLQLTAIIEFNQRVMERLAYIREHIEVSLQEPSALELNHERWLFPELAYTFKHPLTQDVPYNSLLMQRRQELHG